MGWFADAYWDLVYGGACLGCGRPGRALCGACASGLPVVARPAWPTPTPPQLAPPFAAGEYAGLLRDLIVAHKEHQVRSLRPVLGHLLATAVTGGLPAGEPVLLVPAPSRPAATRARGHDPTLALTRSAAGVLRGLGVECAVARLLAIRRGVADQAGLTAEQRAANLAGSVTRRHRAVAELARAATPYHVVICDDVITTGATAREAQRVLEAVGIQVRSIATVAATRRRAVDNRFVRGA